MMTDAEGRFAAGAVRRKKLFLVLSFAGIVVAGLLTAYYGYLRWRDPSYPVAVRAALVVLILLNARQSLRQHRYAAILEKLTRFKPGEVAECP